MDYVLLCAVFAPFVAAPLLAVVGAHASLRRGLLLGRLAVLVPLVSAGCIVYLAFFAYPGGRLVFAWPWISAISGPSGSVGINLSFLVDGLSLFYGLIVSCAGVLVFLYASEYLDEHYEHRNRFFAYLTVFMGAMLGAVFSNNLILLFVFWELTGLASFLLIGFLHGDAESRRGARMALVTTASGGLALLAGLVLFAQVSGSLEFSEIFKAEYVRSAEQQQLFSAAFVLIMIGAFAKSAQFPFHFWLPNAMTAPTPVSAYLHSATMVKLGVFLTARVFAAFAEHDWWSPVLVSIGFGTMIIGGVFALLSHKLKAILAHSTVSQLGYLIGFYGLSLGDDPSARFDFVHVLNHVFYKGCLFMVVGIVDHATGIKDIRQLGGLWRRMPLTALSCALAAAAMAGFPPTVGFLSKEMLLTDTLAYAAGGGALGYAPLAAVLFVSILKVAFSARLVFEIFGGRAAPELARKFNEGSYHAPGFVLQLPPLLLALAAVSAGVFSKTFGKIQYALAVPDVTDLTAGPLKLWHGLNLELLLSLSAILAGAGLYVLARSLRWSFATIPDFLRFDYAADRLLNGLPRFAGHLTDLLQSHRPFRFLPIIAAFTVLFGGGIFWLLFPELSRLWPDPAQFYDRLHTDLNGETSLRAFVAVLIAAFVLTVTLTYRWIIQLIALAGAGFLVTFYFVLYRAPDLALTQLLVEAVTLILTLLLLARFPGQAQRGEAMRGAFTPRRFLQIAVSAGFGVLVSLLAWTAVNYRDGAPPLEDGAQRAGEYYIDNTVSAAAGTNAVNTILVDFRGFDTLLEVGVFLIAALGCLGLVMRYQRRRFGRTGVPNESVPSVSRTRPDERLNSYIYRTVVSFLFFPLLIFSIYLLLRGHNFPGGGFIGGLLTAVSLVLLSFSMGLERFHAVIRVDPMRVAAAGLFVAVAAGLPALFAGAAFLTQYNFKFKDVPLIGELYLGTPLLFDAGVYLLVVGASIKVLFVLAKSTSGLSALVSEEERMYAAPGDEPVE